MSWRTKFRALFRKEKLEAEMAEEMREHLELRIERNLADGMSSDEARQDAQRSFGGVEQLKERCRDEQGARWLHDLVADVRYGWRQLRRSPGFTAAVVLSLALGIGATTAVFGALDRTLLRPLAVKRPSELVRLQWISGPMGGIPRSAISEGLSYRLDPTTGRWTSSIFSLAAFAQFSADHPLLSELFAFARLPQSTVEIDSRIETGNSQVVSGGYYTGLGIKAFRGRTIVPDDDRVTASGVTVISYACWQGRFGGDPLIVGKTIRVNKTPVTVIGVTARNFVDPLIVNGTPEFSFPLAMLPALDAGFAAKKQPDFWWLQVMGRMKSGVSPQQVASSLDAALKSTVRQAPFSINYRGEILSGADDLPLLRVNPAMYGLAEDRQVQARPLLILMGMVVFLLLTACANVGNLFLARAIARCREIGVRLALGANRGRLIRQLLTESGLLAILGAASGMLLAKGSRLLPFVAAQEFDLIDLRTIGFTIAITFIAVLGFGLIPALRASRVNLATEVQSGITQRGRGSTSRLSRTFLVAQVALSFVLLVGAGLFVRTLDNLRAVDLGFERERLLLFSLDAEPAGYRRAQFSRLHASIRDQIAALPGVRSVTYSQAPILGGSTGYMAPINLPGVTPPEGSEVTPHNQVGTDFFAALEIPVLLGRAFSPNDEVTARVAIINETLAKKYFGNESPLGRRLDFVGVREVIGVVGDTKYLSIRQGAGPTVYVPFAQDPFGQANYAVRTSVEPSAIVASIRSAVRGIDSSLPLRSLRTADEQIDLHLSGEREMARLSLFFGGAALVLSCVGLYGLFSFAVQRRTGEIGVRMALGSLPHWVLWMVLRETLRLVGIGVVVGVVAATAAAQLIASMLYGLSSTDPLTYVAVALLLIVVALMACWLPARRAAKVDPMVALRAE